MLRRFLYLNTAALGEYVAAIEGGLLTTSTRRATRSGTGTGGLDVKVAKVSGEKSHEDEESQTLADTNEARFDRLLQTAEADPDALGWLEVVEPDSNFKDIGIGAMISWECDIYIPEIVQAMAGSGEAMSALSKMQEVLPFAKQFNSDADGLHLDTDGLPSPERMGALVGLIGGLDASLLVVGEDDDTDWRVAGQITDEFLHGEVEGRAYIVGKVSKIIPSGRWHPYVTFPGMNLLPRQERRKLERQAPAAGQENNYLVSSNSDFFTLCCLRVVS